MIDSLRQQFYPRMRQAGRDKKISDSHRKDLAPLLRKKKKTLFVRGARWLSGRVSDSGARGPGFEIYRGRVVSLSKTLYSPKVLVNYPGSDGYVPT